MKKYLNKISIFAMAALFASPMLNATDYYYSLDGVYYGTTEPTSGDYETISLDDYTSSQTVIEDSIVDPDGYNVVDSTSSAFGAAISIKSEITDAITGTFIGNTTTNNYNGGGAIFILNNTYVSSISGEFIGNSDPNANGGAVYIRNGAELTSLSGIFIGNSAGVYGGAVCNLSTLGLTASTSDTIFAGNTDSTGSNAIYNTGTVTFNSSNGYSIIVNDGISGSGTFTIESGTTVFNNVVSGQNITVESGATLELGSTVVAGTSYSASLSSSSLTVDSGATLSLAVSTSKSSISFSDDTYISLDNAAQALLDLSGFNGDFSLTLSFDDESEASAMYDFLTSNLDVAFSVGTVDTTIDDNVIVEADSTAYSAIYDEYFYANFAITLVGNTVLINGTAVPEPSTYAIIFGIIALGFASYRRRK